MFAAASSITIHLLLRLLSEIRLGLMYYHQELFNFFVAEKNWLCHFVDAYDNRGRGRMDKSAAGLKQ